MKKIIAAALSMSMVTASLAVPVFADYTAADYDVEVINETFDDGAATNTIDGSKAIKTGSSTEKIFETNLDTTKEFFLSFDFCMDADTALIEIPKYKSSGAVDKVGPRLSVVDGKLVTEIAGSKTQLLGECAVGNWYTAEIEGRTGMGKKYTTFRLYSYTDGEKILVQETPDFDMRNLSSEGRSFNGMGANDASIDNVKLISENPDMIEIISDSDNVDAGQALTFDYTMSRLGVETTKYDVEWNVLDSFGEEITDGSASINNGTLNANISSETQVVTVKASVDFEGQLLEGTKDITINAVDTANEKFDTISVNGVETVEAGSSAEFDVTAMKQGSEVDVTEEDVVWSLYDSENILPYKNKNITIDNGVLTVEDGVVAHDISIRASSVSGKVYGFKKVSIAFGESQKEEVLYYDAYEAGLKELDKQTSIDESTAYMVNSQTDVWQATANQTAYVLTSLDVKFTQDNSGIILMRRDGAKTNTEITYSGGNIKTYGEVLMTEANTDTWYHIEVLYSSGSSDASCNIYTYNEDGILGEPVANLNINRRNAAEYGRLRVQPGTCIDNLVISTPIANEVSITSPGQFMFAGESKQFNATASRNGLPIKNAAGLEWSVLDSDKLPILDGSVTVNESGLVTVDAMTGEQTVTVCVTSPSGASAMSDITIQTSEIFNVTNLGINEAKDRIIRLYVDKNFYYNDDVTFIITIQGDDGTLKAVKLINTFGERLSIGSNEITTELVLPDDFNAETDSINAMVWTTM